MPACENGFMALHTTLAGYDLGPAEEAALEPFDSDAVAGDWFPRAADPHYAELPYYVPLDDEDEASGPFDDDTMS